MFSTNIGQAAISNVNLATDSINLTNFSTNVNYLIPRFWMTVDGNGTILTQIRQPGFAAATVARISTGVYTVTFNNTMNSTNSYVANVNLIRNAGTGLIATIATNTTTAFTYFIQNDASAAADGPAMITVHGF